MKKILITGLPGSGKTTLASALSASLFFENTCEWLNGDAVREKYNDWDFSYAGRIRQSQRMCDLADSSQATFVIADFVAPTNEIRNIFNADYTVWVDTILSSGYADTNTLFESPIKYDVRVTEKDAEKWADIIRRHILGS